MDVANRREATYIRMVPKGLGRVIEEVRSGRPILPLAKRAGISDSRWHQIEGGEGTHAETLWAMGRAMDATPGQLRELFHAGGFGDLFNALVAIGARGRPDIPTSSRAGILADPDLTSEEKSDALEFVELLPLRRARRAEEREKEAR